ncbi:MAG: right-handed parallel beta-helix repeat-containing protein [Actinomycetota bacterium]|nr:right-handed parallel beta-helix repeat-containing protein [Actinomycetota bacterium]
MSFVTGLAGPAAAAVGCGQVITTNTTLTSNVGPCAGNGLVIDGKNITVDLNGFSVIGAAPSSGGGVGIRLAHTTAVVVRNGTVTGFGAGVVVRGGAGNTVANLTVTGNAGPAVVGADFGDGILVDTSASNKITGNVVSHNGPYDGIGVIGSSTANQIAGNRVEYNDVVGAFGQPRTVGILITSGSASDAVSATTIVNNVVRANAANGIELFLLTRNTTVRDNTVEANGFDNTDRGDSSVGRAVGNAGIVLGDGSSGADVQRNEVHGNAGGGILSLGCCGGPFELKTGRNRIVGNNAANNLASPANTSFAKDLGDAFPDCDHNTWNDNRWGTGGYFPACTATGGTGP